MFNKKLVVAVGLMVVLGVLAGGIGWYFVTPHSAAEQLAYAGKLREKLVAESATKSLKEIEPLLRRTVEAYTDVPRKFGKSAPAAEALGQAAKIEEEIAKANDRALALLERISKEFVEPEYADGVGQAYLDQARLIRLQAEALKVGKPPEAIAKYKQAVERLEEYRRKYPKGKFGDAALMEIGRIWQDGIKDPLINAINTFEAFLKEKDYATSEYRPEALFRLAELMEQIKDDARALALYRELEERYPKSRWTPQALDREGKLLAEKMDQQKEAAEKFDKLKAEHPDTPEGRQAGGRAESARQQEAKKQGEEYGKGRYGGKMPTDTMFDKPLPPSAMWEKFEKQKLDAQKYDLDVHFAPAEHRITVEGTLLLVNKGEEKKEILLMLARGMEVKKVAVDGVEAKGELGNDTWTIALPSPLKKEGVATISFAYTGQFAEPFKAPEELLEPKGPATGPGTRPATAPGTEPTTRGRDAHATDTRGRDAHATTSGLTRNMQLALGEYGYALSGGAWYPITVIGDVFEAKMTFHTPPGPEVVANGELVSRSVGAHGTLMSPETPGQFVFQTKRPVFGLYFAYGHYVFGEQTVGKIHYYTYLRDGGKSPEYIKAAADILGYYSEKFGAFPYEKMAIVEVPLPPMLGGVGPASMMMLHEGMVAQQKGPPVNLLAHELAHQWFGNAIPINFMDPDYNQWLSEGFATYADALYTEKTEGPEALAKHMQRYGQLYFQFSLHNRMDSIHDCLPGTALYRPVVYEKGAIVLHALRKVMGDAKFFALLQRFVTEYQDKPTTVKDFRELASKVAGEDLSWFFDQWLDRTIFVHYVIKGVEMKAAATAGGGGTTHVTLKIVQSNAGKDESLVRMPVDITFLDGTGGRHVGGPVMLDKYEQTVEMDVPLKPVKVIVDEGNWVLKHPGTDNVWPVEKPAPEK